jgi:hypothetical protein
MLEGRVFFFSRTASYQYFTKQSWNRVLRTVSEVLLSSHKQEQTHTRTPDILQSTIRLYDPTILRPLCKQNSLKAVADSQGTRATASDFHFYCIVSANLWRINNWFVHVCYHWIWMFLKILLSILRSVLNGSILLDVFCQIYCTWSNEVVVPITCQLEFDFLFILSNSEMDRAAVFSV